MNDLKQAVRYPWQGGDWLNHIVPLALLQIVPLVGQLILIGYGQAVVQAIDRQERRLLQLQLGRAFVDGLRLAAVGIVYCLPVILTVLLALSSGGAAQAENSSGVSGFIFPLLMIAYGSASGFIVKQRPIAKPTFSIINRIVSLA